MQNLRSRIVSHAEKVKKVEEMEEVQAGAFSKDVQLGRDNFELLVHQVIRPVFDDFKATLREIGRDAVIIASLTNSPVQSIGLTLLDRYLSFGAGKTLKLVNPKEDISKRTTTKFYEIYRNDEDVYIRHRTDPLIAPVITLVQEHHITPRFLEDELASFFERAYPTAL